MPQSTARRYLGLLEGVFLVHKLTAWSTNRSKRLVRSPERFVLDTGPLCHLQGLDA